MIDGGGRAPRQSDLRRGFIKLLEGVFLWGD